jgi:outer membrane receptor for ferrienterochelin and colicin
LDDAAAIIVLVHDATAKQKMNSLVERLRNMESVNLMGLGHNRCGFDVAFRHDRRANVRGLWWG